MKIFPSQRGFTLIETLFAVLIFSASLVSLMTIAARGIAATAAARGQITAHYLAQEGLEVVRNARDDKYLAAQPWDADFAGCTPSAPCEVVYGNGSNAPTLGNCANPCRVFDQNGAFVDAPGNGASGYVRTIVATPKAAQGGNPPTEYEIVSTVEWMSRGITRRVELATILKQWM